MTILVKNIVIGPQIEWMDGWTDKDRSQINTLIKSINVMTPLNL